MAKATLTTQSQSLSTSSTQSPLPLPTQSTFPLIPLTTTFTPPASCTGIYITNSYVSILGEGIECLPSGFAPEPTSFFSPGIACPSGYYTACQNNLDVPSITTVTCCPTVSGLAFSCVNASTLVSPWTNLFCTWEASTTTTILVTQSSDGTTSIVPQTAVSPEGVNAYGVRMVYQSSDLATTSSQTSSTTSNPSSTTSSSSSPTAQTSASGISLGAKVAIGVVIPVFVLALALGGFLLWRRKRAKNRNESADKSANGSSPEWTPPMGYSSVPQRPEELPATQKPVELPGERKVVELEAER